jgi:hypothetical protein
VIYVPLERGGRDASIGAKISANGAVLAVWQTNLRFFFFFFFFCIFEKLLKNGGWRGWEERIWVVEIVIYVPLERGGWDASIGVKISANGAVLAGWLT